MSIPKDLRTAYEKTHYRVLAARPFTLLINRVSDELGELHELNGVDRSFYITAYNPFSESRSEAENNSAHMDLLEYVKQQGWDAIEGEGVDPEGKWASEKSLLVLGASRRDADSTGRIFKQNAILWMGVDVTPRLIVLRQ